MIDEILVKTNAGGGQNIDRKNTGQKYFWGKQNNNKSRQNVGGQNTGG